jgi:peptidoglycan/LPS O-acetylase OafA/YrhL
MTNLDRVDTVSDWPKQTSRPVEAERDVAFLNPLTGLRFFAAFAIMMLHGDMTWQMPAAIAPLALNQGVSFFFVLSGFILTYVYRELRSLKAVFQFYVTRLARIWPVHIASTILLFIVLPATAYGLWSRHSRQLAALYVTLTQAWFPVWESFLQLNGISWTISVEWFFYLLFPVFLLDWRTSEWVKLLVAAIPALLVIAFSNAIHAPQRDWAPGLTEHGLIYIFPPCRLFEFVFGIVCAKTWLSTMDGRKPTAVVSFVLELVAVLGVYLALRYCGPTSRTQFVNDIGGSAGAHWLLVNGFTPAFAFLIFVFASSTGPLAAFVGSRVLVRLGEISFSLYMVHTIVLDIFERYPRTINALIFLLRICLLGRLDSDGLLHVVFCRDAFSPRNPALSAAPSETRGRYKQASRGRAKQIVRRGFPRGCFGGGGCLFFRGPAVSETGDPRSSKLRTEPHVMAAHRPR